LTLCKPLTGGASAFPIWGIGEKVDEAYIMAIPYNHILNEMVNSAWNLFAKNRSRNLKYVDLFSKIGPIEKPKLDRVKIRKIPGIEIKPYE